MKKIKLSKSFDIFNGTTPSTLNPLYYGGEMVWLTPKDFSEKNDKYYNDSERKITDLALKEVSLNVIPENSLLLTSRAPIGLLGINTVPSATNQGFKSLVPKESSEIEVEYLYYYFKHRIQDLINLGGGTTFKEITKTVLEEFEVLVPNYSIQEDISRVLGHYDQKIELNNKIISELESLTKLIYEYWFIQFDFPDENGKPYKSSGGKMVWNEKLKREIPEGWGVVKLGDLVEFTKTKMKPNAKEKLIDLSVMNSGTLTQNDFNNGDFSKTNLYELKKGDILWGSIRPYLNKYAIAPFDGLVAGTIHRLRVKKDYYHSFVIGLVMSEYFLKFSVSQSEGTKMPVIKEDALRNIYVPYNEEIYKKFYEILSIDKLIPNLIEENHELRKQRDFLLPLLMNGQVTIK